MLFDVIGLAAVDGVAVVVVETSTNIELTKWLQFRKVPAAHRYARVVYLLCAYANMDSMEIYKCITMASGSFDLHEKARARARLPNTLTM